MTDSLNDNQTASRIDRDSAPVIFVRFAWLGIQLILIYYCGSTGALFFYQGF